MLFLNYKVFCSCWYIYYVQTVSSDTLTSQEKGKEERTFNLCSAGSTGQVGEKEGH